MGIVDECLRYVDRSRLGNTGVFVAVGHSQSVCTGMDSYYSLHMIRTKTMIGIWVDGNIDSFGRMDKFLYVRIVGIVLHLFLRLVLFLS